MKFQPKNSTEGLSTDKAGDKPEINTTGHCSDCKEGFPLNDLKHLPETEGYLRSFDPSKPETVQGGVDLKTLLCLTCHDKRFGIGGAKHT